jgi:hypothetical protein
MGNYYSKEASSLSHKYEILLPLLIPKFHYHIHNSLPLKLYTARSIQSSNYAIRFNIILHLYFCPWPSLSSNFSIKICFDFWTPLYSEMDPNFCAA